MKSIKRSSKEIKEGLVITLKDSEDQIDLSGSKCMENLDFAVKFFILSVAVLISTNIYIHKNVSFLLLRITIITISG
jgi:hypothetical protein